MLTNHLYNIHLGTVIGHINTTVIPNTTVNIVPKVWLNDKLVLVPFKISNIVHLSPFTPVDESNEQSCFMMLLMHTIWPDIGEEGLLLGYTTAVEALRSIKQNGMLPKYVLP